ncbi:unnamed protein product [Diatraea saccharalis]|uniref:Glycosyl hydrolase family 13 catalytic domain-containing protein n=1 Tax=Diatraea saccharalis TaxID=40085 RepID=A0A9N9QWF3_9NEOP|nr:unnamed protein product [Diatraea saccharalis]
MTPLCKNVFIGIGALLVTGLVVGSVTWAILASRTPTIEAPEIIPLDWWQHAVIYQIYPRSFQDSDGDGIGDLKGITNRMEHFVETGIDAIWMSPIFESPMIDFGYDISNFYEIHHEYGTMEDFEELVAKAHELGKIICYNYNQSFVFYQIIQNSSLIFQALKFYWTMCRTMRVPNHYTFNDLKQESRAMKTFLYGLILVRILKTHQID